MKTCLIVDDDSVSRYTARLFLEQLGYEVLEAENGEEALEALIEKNIDLILLDWHLKQDNGLNLIEMMRIAAGDESLPIIVFSGVEGKESQDIALKAGANDFMRKPTSIEKIEASIRKVAIA